MTEMSAPAVEIVHVNGAYDPITGEHSQTPALAELTQRLHNLTVSVIASGGAVLYRPNLTNAAQAIGDVDASMRALASDPYLSLFDREVREKIAVRIGGGGAGLPLDHVKETVALEDRLARKFGTIYVMGAFTTECVIATARNIKSRNPESTVAVDPRYSVERRGRGDELYHAANAARVIVADIDKQLSE